MDNDNRSKEEKIKSLEDELSLVIISLRNAVTKINNGHVVSADTIRGLKASKKELEEKIDRLKNGNDETDEENRPPGDPQDDENEKEEIGIPDRLRIKRHYTLSEKAIDQRKEAAKKKKPKNKESLKGNKNAWKHGRFAQSYMASFIKPCKSTCPDYPCEIIEQGATEPGEMCLDRANVMQGYRAIINALDNGKYKDFNDLAALTLSKTINTIQMLLDDIMRDGTMAKKEKWDKDGKSLGFEIVPHPSLFALPKLLQSIGGIAPDDLGITPKARDRNKSDKRKAKTIADFLSNIGGGGGKNEEGD